MTDEMRRKMAAIDDLNTRLSDLLERTVNVLRGEPDSDSLHSWHDVPELAQAFKNDSTRLHAALVMVLYAYIKETAYPDRPSRDHARAKAAFETGKALGEHDKLIEALNA
jgi:hypothetical protein